MPNLEVELTIKGIYNTYSGKLIVYNLPAEFIKKYVDAIKYDVERAIGYAIRDWEFDLEEEGNVRGK